MGAEQNNAKSIKSLLDEYKFSFSKSKGQNFLIDKNIPEKIVRMSGIDSACGVLEIGPGTGALTLELCRAAGHVTAVELDKRLLPILNEVLSGIKNIDIVQGDILKLDLKKLVSEKMPGYAHHICANLPYNITTSAISSFIKADAFVTITVMVQKEVAKRICAVPGSSDYGAFSVFINYHTEPSLLFDVPPGCFVPRPKVWSSVILMKSRTTRLLQSDEEKLFFRVVRASFAQRRKTIVNALCSAFGNETEKEDIRRCVERSGLDPQIRGESLSIADFSMLSAELRRLFQTCIQTLKK